MNFLLPRNDVRYRMSLAPTTCPRLPHTRMQGQARKTTMHRHVREANRLSWNAATRAHNSHKGDQAAFFRAGGSTLRDEERALLGDLTNKQVAHLLCNS